MHRSRDGANMRDGLPTYLWGRSVHAHGNSGHVPGGLRPRLWGRDVRLGRRVLHDVLH